MLFLDPESSLMNPSETTPWAPHWFPARLPDRARACPSPVRHLKEAAISGSPTNYSENFIPADDVVTAAAQRGAELGADPISAGAGATLRLIAAAIDARSVVEIGTGCGVSAVWLLRGMHPEGVLTSIDVEAEQQRLARQAFVEAGFAPARSRLICGAALDVVPRLTDGGYDLVFCDGAPMELPDYLREAMRLLRPGGIVAFYNALGHGHVPDPAQRDADTIAIRDLGKTVRDDPRLVAALVPIGEGLLIAVKRDG
jgi:predicted O-methyltransferase YrrM